MPSRQHNGERTSLVSALGRHSSQREVFLFYSTLLLIPIE